MYNGNVTDVPTFRITSYRIHLILLVWITLTQFGEA